MKPAAFLLACALWLTTGLTYAATPPVYVIAPDVIASGGGMSTSASYTVRSTVGQAAIGMSDSAAYQACSGYWCGNSILGMRTYLPVVRRG